MIRRLFSRAVRIFWLLPGFLLWASFPPMAEKTDCLFALAPLLWLARRGDAKKSAKTWFANGCLFWVATLAWMPAIVKNGGPWPLVVLGWGALAAYCALYFGAFGYLAARYWAWARPHEGILGETVGGEYWKRLAGALVVEPVLWAGLEIVRSRLFGGFSWNQLGVPAVNAGFGSPAAFGGVYLLSALVILVNGSITGIVERMWQPEKSGFAALRKFGSLETIIVIAIIFGCYNLPSPDVSTHESDPSAQTPTTQTQTPEHPNTQTPILPLNVALIQRNFPCVFERDRRENPAEVYSNLLSRVALLKPDLIVLPESAAVEAGAVDSPRGAAFARFVMELGGASAVLMGGGRWTETKEYNSAGLYVRTEKGLSLQLYDKVHLVPFGEFIPGDKLIPALQKLAPVGSCTAGELKLITLTDLPLGVAICYEDTDSAQMRRLARMGARALVFITNDSWFSYSDETVQHAWQSVARAIETGLPVIRVGNSGVTGTIAPDGTASWLSVDGKMLVDASGSMFDRVTPAAEGVLTWYVRLGDKPLFVAFLLLILLMIVIKYKDYYEKRRTLSL